MKEQNYTKWFLFLIFSLLFFNFTVFAELPEELRKEVIAFIRPGYLDFPEQENSALPLGSFIINSAELSDAFSQYGVLTIQRGFPDFTDGDTIRTSETGYTFLIPQFSRIFRLQLISQTYLDSLINTLMQMTDVIVYAEKNSDAELLQAENNDELFGYQWYLYNDGH